MFKKIIDGIVKFFKVIGHGIKVAIIALYKAIVVILSKLWDLVSDEKNQFDERRLWGNACYAVAIWLVLQIPDLVKTTKDLAGVGAMAAIITVLVGAGAALLKIAQSSDASIMDNLPPQVNNVITKVENAIGKVTDK